MTISGKGRRRKGHAGEREVAALLTDLLGVEITRKCRQHDGDSDLIGLDGWAVEVKHHATATPGQVAAWYAQAVEQAKGSIPVLIYRNAARPRQWRAVWPIAALLTEQKADMWIAHQWAAETSVEAFAAVVREMSHDIQE